MLMQYALYSFYTDNEWEGRKIGQSICANILCCKWNLLEFIDVDWFQDLGKINVKNFIMWWITVVFYNVKYTTSACYYKLQQTHYKFNDKCIENNSIIEINSISWNEIFGNLWWFYYKVGMVLLKLNLCFCLFKQPHCKNKIKVIQ